MDCSMPGFLVLRCIPDFVQTHVHWVSHAIQPSHPLTPFSSCLQSFPASGYFPVSWPFASGGHSIGTSASASILPMNIQDWFPLELTLISLQSKGFSRVFSNTTIFKASVLWPSFLYGPTHTPIHDYWKNHSFEYTDLCHKVLSLLFNTLSRFGIVFIPRSKCLNVMVAVTVCSDFGAQENKSVTVSIFSPVYLPWTNGTGFHHLSFLNVES